MPRSTSRLSAVQVVRFFQLGSPIRSASRRATSGTPSGIHVPLSSHLDNPQEKRYREEVRREVRREAGAGSTWSRVLAMLKLEPGISEEIASDPNSTKRGLVVVIVANVAACLFVLPVVLITIPATLVAIAVTAGLYCLFSRLFANEVPAYPNWFRILLFTSAPTALGIVPIVGALVGSVYTIVLHVVAIRDLARITTGAAIVV